MDNVEAGLEVEVEAKTPMCVMVYSKVPDFTVLSYFSKVPLEWRQKLQLKKVVVQ